MWRVGGRPNGDVGRFEACRSRGLKLNADKSSDGIEWRKWMGEGDSWGYDMIGVCLRI